MCRETSLRYCIWKGLLKCVQGGRGGEESAWRCGVLFIAHGTSIHILAVNFRPSLNCK
jgi:hypothetical protein